MLPWQDPAEGNLEKLLLKLATKGVVKLFNVIQQQQKVRNEEKGRADAGLCWCCCSDARLRYMRGYSAASIVLPFQFPRVEC